MVAEATSDFDCGERGDAPTNFGNGMRPSDLSLCSLTLYALYTLPCTRLLYEKTKRQWWMKKDASSKPSLLHVKKEKKNSFLLGFGGRAEHSTSLWEVNITGAFIRKINITGPFA